MQREPHPPRLEAPVTGGHASEGAPATAEVQQYLDLLRRRWWVIAAAGLIALFVAWWGERNRVPQYTAEVLLEQRGESPLIGMGAGGQGGEFGSHLEMIRSRTVVAAVVDSLGLQLVMDERQPERSRILEQVQVEREASPGSYRLALRDGRLVLSQAWDGETVATASTDQSIAGPGFRFRLRNPSALDPEPLHLRIQDRQVAVERLQGRIRVEPGRAPSLVRIGYRDPDPEMAAAVVNGMAAAYQAARAAGAREAASRRREVIAGQLVGLADSLEQAQAEVVEYQRGTRLLSPEYEGGRMMAAVLDIENELRELRFQEGLLASLATSLRGDERADESLHQILSLGSELVPAGPTLHQRLQELEIERSRMTASDFGRLEGDPAVQVVDSLIASTKSQMRTAVEQGLEHLRTRIRGAEDRLAQMRGDMGTIPGQTAELARLRQRANAVQEVVDVLVDRYYEAQIAEAVEAGDVTVIDPAPVPLRPDPSRTRIVLLVGLIGGLMMGVLGALAMEFFDLRVRRATDAEDITGLPLVAMVPKLGSPTRDRVSAAIGKEAFRSLRTNLRFAHGGTAPRTISVSSATPREGKTTVALNLAASLAEQQGSESVLIIDVDLRRPQVHEALGMARAPGLTDVLTGTADLDEALRTSPSDAKLQVLTCGRQISNPSELIGSQGFIDLFGRLEQRFGYVVVDTPPLLAVTDGAVIAKIVDGTLMVVRAGQVDRRAVSNAIEKLRQIDATLLGVVLNAVEARTEDGRYAHAYYEDYLVETPADSEADSRKGTTKRGRLLGTGAGKG